MDFQRPASPIFNLDVLLHIMALCDRRTKSRLSRAWKVLQEHAARYILEGTVRIFNHNFDSLHRFLSVDGFSRTRFLRDLELWVDDDREFDPLAPFGRRLVSILQHSTQLESLFIGCAEYVVDSCPGTSLCDALSGLATLRHLRIHQVGLSARDFMANLHLPALVSMDLEYSSENPDPSSDVDSEGEAWEELLNEEEIPSWHPALVCGQLAPTLEKLTTAFTNPRTDLVPWADLDLPIYPNLHTLVLDDDWPFARPWILSCPHLKCLTLTSDRWDPDLRCELGLEALPDWTMQRRFNLTDQRANGSWTALEEYTGDDVALLYSLGLTCRIPRLVLSEVMGEEVLKMFGPIISEAKPADLVLEVTELGKFLGDPDGEAGIATIFLQDGAGSHIERLDLHLHMSMQEVFEMDHHAVTQTLFNTLALLPALEHLTLHFAVRTNVQYRTPSDRVAVDLYALPEPFATVMEPVRLVERAMAVMATIRVLEIVVRTGWTPRNKQQRRSARVDKNESDQIVACAQSPARDFSSESDRELLESDEESLDQVESDEGSFDQVESDHDNV
ncbi:hypothetical protein BV20DRAFT_500454 [Pilatotrama ljubarskyi]|nr:hypothetical protein BV20DRAFT_500454 [Pilatotrama ljubarskyi]